MINIHLLAHLCSTLKELIINTSSKILHSVGSRKLSLYSILVNVAHKMEALGVELSVGFHSVIITGGDVITQYNLKKDRRPYSTQNSIV
jgi:hypothetical protein